MSAHAIVAFFEQVSLDWYVFAGIALLFAIDTLRSGPARATSFALALSISALALAWIPNTAFIGAFAKGSGLLIVAAIVFALSFVIAHRMTHAFVESEKPVQAILAGLAAAIAFTVVWIRIPALASLHHPAPGLVVLFGASYGLLWLLGALAALAVSRN